MWPNLQFPADLVTFTEKILNKKLHFFVRCGKLYLVKISSWSSEKPFEKHFPRNNNFQVPGAWENFVKKNPTLTE